MAMVPGQGYGWPPHQPPSFRTRPRLGGGVWARIRHQLAIGLALFTAALLFGLLRSPRGLLAVGLAWALVGLLSAHRANGRGLRAVLEYGLVALLVLLVANVGTTPEPPAVPRPPVKVEATQADQLKQARGAVADLWQRAASGFSRFNEPPANGGR
jgi:hypothetical protein